MPRYLHEKGLDAFEYQAVRWGQKPKISKKDAKKLRERADYYDVWLSMHCSYYINLADKKKVGVSIDRLMVCLQAASWIGAHTVVFHPGFYKRRTPEQALKTCIDALREVEERMDALGIRDVYLGPETTGRSSQLGSLEEVLRICEEIKSARPVVDWAHLHARDGSASITGKESYMRVLETIEERLGTDVIENLHIHFSKIEFTNKGERKHHTLSEENYGPEFRPLAEIIVEMDLKPVIICESPILDVDAVKMRDILREIQKEAK